MIDATKGDNAADAARRKVLELFDEIFAFGGFGGLRVEIKLMKRGQKEIIISGEKQHRFVADWRSFGRTEGTPSLDKGCTDKEDDSG